MKNKKHMDFLRRIRIPGTQAKKKDSSRKLHGNAARRKTEQEELNLQKELERRLEELFICYHVSISPF